MPAKILNVFGKIILTVVIFLILSIVGMLLILLLTIIHTGKIDLSLLNEPYIENSLLVMQFLTTIGTVLIMYLLFERSSGLSLGLKQKNRLKAVFEGSVWGICLMTISFLAIFLFGGIKITGIGIESAVLQDLIIAAGIFILVSVSEELLCRGYWYGIINRYFSAKITIISTAVLFAALHLFNDNILQSPIPLINLFLAGILFGVAREYTRGLWVPIGIHFTWNLFQGNVFGFAVSGLHFQEHSFFQIETVGHHLISGGDFGAEGSIITGILTIAFTVIIAWWHSRGKSTATESD